MSCVDLKGKTILVTGTAGFIGSNLVKRLYNDVKDVTVVGIDDMNDYYDVQLKEARLEELSAYPSFIFIKGSIADRTIITELFDQYKPQVVVNLAAQAGVRYSITNPDAYVESNLIGFYNILEACRHSYDDGGVGVEHLVYASSSSVYGSNKKVPYSTDDKVDKSGEPLRSDQEEYRASGTCIFQALQYPIYRVAVLHSVWPCRSAGYGVLWLFQQAESRGKDSDFQLRKL